MDRRKSIKALLVGSMATGVLVEACKPSDKKAIAESPTATLDADRMQEEKDALKNSMHKRSFSLQQRWLPSPFWVISSFQKTQ